MLAIVTLILFMALAIIMGNEQWRGKSGQYVILTMLALLQTALIALDMFTMKMPKK
ncbi:MAG: hypothetical protein ACLP05_01325 [Candidatus Kryptoniota bacterium]